MVMPTITAATQNTAVISTEVFARHLFILREGMMPSMPLELCPSSKIVPTIRREQSQQYR